MREIKFRMWDAENNTMIDGDSLAFEEYAPISHLLTQEGIMQYTGLKDKNGKEIYEGDVLDGSWVNPMSQETVKRHYKVAFDKANYYAELIGHHPYGTTMLYFENEKSAVIGNIYEHPHLLETPKAIGTTASHRGEAPEAVSDGLGR